jgi:hypothetical protein
VFTRTLLTTDSPVVRIPFVMAKKHTYFFRRPGRRDEERKRFAALMRKVEVVPLRYGMTKAALAVELQTTKDGLRAWATGRTIGRRQTVAKIEDFLKRKSVGSDGAV